LQAEYNIYQQYAGKGLPRVLFPFSFATTLIFFAPLSFVAVGLQMVERRGFQRDGHAAPWAIGGVAAGKNGRSAAAGDCDEDRVPSTSSAGSVA
jgi:hypothetical protein